MSPTTTVLRPELDALPARMKDLPIDSRGYVIPWFVAWVDGKPEFRGADVRKWVHAVQESRCWVCGKRLGTRLAFVSGPMCAVTRTSSEPPSHRECAMWSIRNCPFLGRPQMRRREGDLPGEYETAGIMIKRNPGVSVLWITKDYKVFKDPAGHPLIAMGEPEEILFWREGREATRSEIEESVTTGLPALEEYAKQDGNMEELRKQVARFWSLVPTELR